MKKLGKIRRTAQLAHKIATAQKDIKNCPYCNQKQEEILQHTMRGHPKNDI